MNHTLNISCVTKSQTTQGVRQVATMIVAAVAGPAVRAAIEINAERSLTSSWIFGSKAGSPGWQR